MGAPLHLSSQDPINLHTQGPIILQKLYQNDQFPDPLLTFVTMTNEYLLNQIKTKNKDKAPFITKLKDKDHFIQNKNDGLSNATVNSLRNIIYKITNLVYKRD